MTTELDLLIARRKELKLTRVLAAKLMGYSTVWLNKVENTNERRVSKDFVKQYKRALKKYETWRKKWN